MKSLNRTLSLVLVLAMVLGLMGVASAATFTDKSSVQYNEAVEVMTGIGAISGYTDGSFKPTGTITREEAAKMVAYAVLSSAVASKLSVAATGFSDVAATRWSAPYIAYCVGKGIISGMGDGTFAPTANVTGYQLAKMLLCAAGYGAKNEFTGSGWELNVAVLGNKCKVFSGSKATDYSKAATREECALYVFNAIDKTAQVSYSKLTEAYSSIEEPGATGDDKLVYTIAEQVYPTLAKSTLVVDGVTSYYWTLDGKQITGTFGDASVLATSTNGTPIEKLVDPAKADYIGYQANTSDQDSATAGVQAVEYYLNGTSKGYDATGLAAVTTAAQKKGAVVKFLDTGTDSKYDVISVTVDAVVKLSAAPTVTTSGTITYVTIGDITGLNKIDSKNVIGYDGLAKDDYVMWHKDAAGRFFITKCTSVTGTLVAYNTIANTATVDSKTYYLSAIDGAASMVDVSGTAGKAGTVFYLDQGGNIVKAVAATSAVNLTNVVYVADVQASGFAVQAFAVFGDGTSSVITVSKVDTKTVSATGDVTKEKFYTYVKNDNGTYTLKTTTNAQDTQTYNVATARTAVTKAQANFMTNANGSSANVLATASTVFAYRNETTKAFTLYTGITNAPSYKTDADAGTSEKVAYLCDSNGYAIFVVALGGTPDNTSGSLDYVFATLPGTTIYNAAGNYYTFAAVVNGEVKTIDAIDQADLTADGALTVGTLTAVTAYTNGKVSATDDDAGLINAFANSTGIDNFAVNGTTVAYKVSVKQPAP